MVIFLIVIKYILNYNLIKLASIIDIEPIYHKEEFIYYIMMFIYLFLCLKLFFLIEIMLQLSSLWEITIVVYTTYNILNLLCTFR